MTIIYRGYGGKVLSMVLGILFGVVGFWTVAGWLGIVGSAEGRRRVWGIQWVSFLLCDCLGWKGVKVKKGQGAGLTLS